MTMCCVLAVTPTTLTEENDNNSFVSVPQGLNDDRTTHSSDSSTEATEEADCHLYVQHNYQDHAFDKPDPTVKLRNGAKLVISPTSNATFPFKLYSMLQRIEVDGFSSVISFLPHGRAFCVHRPKELEHVLPHYFAFSKQASFLRQLNMYGFTRMSKGADRGAYYHELFLKGRPDLIPRITRIKLKGTGVRARANPDQEPDLWKLKWMVDEEEDFQTVGTDSIQVAQETREHSTHDNLYGDGNRCRGTLDFFARSVSLSDASLSGREKTFEEKDSGDRDMVVTAWGRAFHVVGDIDDVQDIANDSVLYD